MSAGAVEGASDVAFKEGANGAVTSDHGENVEKHLKGYEVGAVNGVVEAAGAAAHSEAECDGEPILLFCRMPGEPYVCCGRCITLPTLFDLSLFKICPAC